MKRIIICFSFFVFVISCKTPLEKCGCLGIDIHKNDEGLLPQDQLNENTIDSFQFEHIYINEIDSVITILEKLDNLKETPNILIPYYDYLIRLRCDIGCGGYDYLDYYVNSKYVKLNDETYSISDSIFEYLATSYENYEE